MAVRIAILANFQHESLAIALGALLPDADIISVDLDGVADDNAARAQVAATLAACDHLISHDVAPEYGPLSTRALRPVARNYHLLPVLNFGGFHPDCVSVRLDRTKLGGPAGGLHSRIVAAGVLAGLTAEEIIDLFNPLVFARLGYFDALAQHSALLVETFAAYAIDLGEYVAKWRARGCFMTSPNHPKMLVFLDLARIACAMMGQSAGASPPITSLRDPLAARETVPFLPEIAARCGLPPEGVFRDTLPARPLTLAEFVRGSVLALARAPLSCLRAVVGVPEALARLDLRVPPPQHRAIVITPGSRCLLSWQGTIVRIEAASSLIVHEPLWPPSEACSDFILDPVPGPDGIARAAILGGLDVAPGTIAGTVTLSRQGRAMQAEAGRLAVPFKGEGSAQSEAFLALGVAEIGYLRDILAQDWLAQDRLGQDRLGQDAAEPAPPRRVAAARIRLRPGFLLDLAMFTIDLTEARPVRVADAGEGAAGYRFATQAGSITLRPIAEPAHGREIALVADPQRRLPHEAGSIPAFRTAVQASWSLAAPDEIAHPPLTANDRDTAWVFERCTWPGGLPSGLQQHHAALRRMPDRAVLLSPGLEGIVFDAAGTMTETPAPSLARGQSLPPGVRQEEGALLIQAERLAAAPAIDEPVALCLSPGCLGPDWSGPGGLATGPGQHRWLADRCRAAPARHGALPAARRTPSHAARLWPGRRPGRDRTWDDARGARPERMFRAGGAGAAVPPGRCGVAGQHGAGHHARRPAARLSRPHRRAVSRAGRRAHAPLHQARRHARDRAERGVRRLSCHAGLYDDRRRGAVAGGADRVFPQRGDGDRRAWRRAWPISCSARMARACWRFRRAGSFGRAIGCWRRNAG